MIYRARIVVTMDGLPIDNGAVAIEGNRIKAVGTFTEVIRLCESPVIDLGEQVILPGFINAHCHLDYTMMRRAIAPQKSFTKWISRINAMKRSLDDEDYLDAIAKGFMELKKWGVTTVLNIEAFPELMFKMNAPPIRTWWFYELIDVRNRIATEELVAGVLLFFQQHPNWMGGFGLSPHSPYTASPDLYRLANDCAKVMGMPVTTHVGESSEEDSMFRNGNGELYDFVSSIGRRMDDCGKGSSFHHLISQCLVGPDWIIAHLNELDDNDFHLFSDPELAAGMHVVHCPRSHRYFGHQKFQFKRLHDLGINISVGTDSLASNDSLNLFSEMQTLQKTELWMSSEDLLKTVTVNPARALKHQNLLGRIKPGAYADLISIPFTNKSAGIYDEIVNYQKPIEWIMVDGQIYT